MLKLLQNLHYNIEGTETFLFPKNLPVAVPLHLINPLDSSPGIIKSHALCSMHHALEKSTKCFSLKAHKSDKPYCDRCGYASLRSSGNLSVWKPYTFKRVLPFRISPCSKVARDTVPKNRPRYLSYRYSPPFGNHCLICAWILFPIFQSGVRLINIRVAAVWGWHRNLLYS